MASKLADAVRMKPGDLCLDVGFGCGDQDIWWHQQYGVDIVGVEVIPSQVSKCILNFIWSRINFSQVKEYLF